MCTITDAVEVMVYRSELDNAPVVEIDTQVDTGVLRVNLNDGLIWDGDPEVDDAELQLSLDVQDDGGMAKHYLSTTEVAERIGVTRGSLSNLKLPAPDVTIGTTRGWSEKTIDKWNAERPGRGGRWEKDPTKKR